MSNSNASNINSAVSNATNINTVATNIGSVNTVATDISKVIEYSNKKLKKNNYIITDDQWDKIKKDFVSHMEDNAVFNKHSFNHDQGWKNGFNTGFCQSWEEYLIVDITKKENK